LTAISYKALLKAYWCWIVLIGFFLLLKAFIISYMVRLNFKLRRSQEIILKNEEELRRSEQKFRSIIEESAEGISLADEQGNVIEWNQSM